MVQSGYYRRYVILEELDTGFGVQRSPEGFVRFDGNREGITVSLQIRNIREGTEPYTVILIYGKNDEIGVLRVGALEVYTRNGYLRRNLDYAAIEAMGMQPDNMQYVIVASEHPERVSIPLIGLCNKSKPWDESIRQRILKQKPKPQDGNKVASSPIGQADRNNIPPETRQMERRDVFENIGQPEKSVVPSETKPDNIRKTPPIQQSDRKESFWEARQLDRRDTYQEARQIDRRDTYRERRQPESRPSERDILQSDRRDIPQEPYQAAKMNTSHETNYSGIKHSFDQTQRSDSESEERTITRPMDKSENKVDDIRLERKLKEAFEGIEPFDNPRHDYAWYKVNDLARLSNLLYACNLRIPLFANPKILVGLFKYRHLLAGFYRSDHTDMNYFVLGVPSRDDSEGRPFENISRWVESQNVEYGDMTGYWLVYINLRSGDFVT